ncbi:MAG: hypothetical protein AAF628_03725 [Planctomycetota bacterium]
MLPLFAAALPAACLAAQSFSRIYREPTGSSRATAIAATVSGGMVVTTSGDGNDATVYHLDPAGNPLWSVTHAPRSMASWTTASAR